MRKRHWLAGLGLVGCVIAGGASLRVMGRAAAAPPPSGQMVPVFEVDAAWPKLPNDWVLGNVSKIVVDRHDNVWLIHRPRTVAAGKMAAPPVVELDANGKFVQAWGGDGAGYDWPDAEHNIFVDHKDNVWISGSSPSGQSKTKRSDDMIDKFTNKGKVLLEIGGRSVSKGSTDPKSVNKPGDLFVSAKTNEDDPDSGGPGASGGPLNAEGAAEGGGAPRTLDTEGDGSPKFASPVHGVLLSNDNILYVVDRSNRRVQLFTPEGKYLTQVFINRAGPAAGSASGLAFSPDKDQQFLYISDYGNSHVVVLDRKKLTVLYQFGKRGATPGDFQGIHHIAVDSKGNLYAAEVAPGARAQKFNFKGMSPTLPANALSATDLAPKPAKP